jgi:NAD(P)H-quinone oxidoreductase subunit 6
MILTVVFVLLALIAVFSTIAMMWIKDLVRIFFLFFAVLVCIAGLMLFALADFIAISHLLIYIGGILVLMLFALMLAGQQAAQWQQQWVKKQDRMHGWLALLMSFCFFGLFAYFALQMGYWNTPNWIKEAIRSQQTISANRSGIKPLGQLLMTKYLLPFELISILLLMVLLGATHVSRKPDAL